MADWSLDKLHCWFSWRITLECRTHEEHGDVIDEGEPDHQLATLVGTKTGIDALAEFVRKSKAFQKTQAAEFP